MARSRAKFHEANEVCEVTNSTGNHLTSKEAMAKQGLLERSSQGKPEKGGRGVKRKDREVRPLRKRAIG